MVIQMEQTRNIRFNKPRVDRRQVTEIDVDHVIKYLSRQFRQRTEHMGREASRGTDLYNFQVEFSYIIDEIKRGPMYHASKVIAQANEFLDAIPAE